MPSRSCSSVSIRLIGTSLISGSLSAAARRAALSSYITRRPEVPGARERQ
ncbi:hypothetical protein SCALM49S_05315 [Streptomyces californicus]